MMDSAQYTRETMSFMRKHKEHSADFKILVLRLLNLYNNNMKLVSAMTSVPETVILKWKSEWNNVMARHQAIGMDTIKDENTK